MTVSGRRTVTSSRPAPISTASPLSKPKRWILRQAARQHRRRVTGIRQRTAHISAVAPTVPSARDSRAS
ncbi:hypothetical protein SALBM311S_01171 [Streptomyces alboniger]